MYQDGRPSGLRLQALDVLVYMSARLRTLNKSPMNPPIILRFIDEIRQLPQTPPSKNSRELQWDRTINRAATKFKSSLGLYRGRFPIPVSPFERKTGQIAIPRRVVNAS